MRNRKASDWLADFLMTGFCIAFVLFWTIVIPMEAGQ